MVLKCSVAPVWERGLKYFSADRTKYDEGRSRLGAWIEIQRWEKARRFQEVAPVWERGLKYLAPAPDNHVAGVAPVWERGLKCDSI